MIKTVVLTLMITVLLVGTALAAPSFTGPTGLFTVPTAEVTGNGDFDFGLNYIAFEGDSQVTAVANYGALDNLEVGLAFIMPRNDSNLTWLNAKYRLVQPTAVTPAVAVGVVNLTGSQGTDMEFYGVATFPIQLAGATLTAGLAITGSDTRLMAGASFPVFAFTEAIVEQNDNINIGLRFNAPVLPLNIDLTLFDLLDTRSLGIAAGYTLTF